MEDLLKAFSIQQIVLFVVLAAAAIKGVITWIDWAKGKFNEKFKEKEKEKETKDQIQSLIESQQKMQNEVNSCQVQIKDCINSIKESIDLLMASDRDDIKAWITEKHHYFCYTLGYIDDYSLDCIEKRYSHYKREGGNSFVEQLMEEIRALPKTASEAKK